MPKIDRETKNHPDSAKKPEKSDPRMINGHFHKNPIDACYHIKDFIERMERNDAEISGELNAKLSKLLECMGYVRDAYYNREDMPLLKPLLSIPREEVINMINALNELIASPEFWKAVEVLFPPRRPKDYGLSPLHHTNPKTKEGLKSLFEKYVELFRYFAMEN